MSAFNPADVEDTILDLLRGCGSERTIGPMDVARALGGDHPDGWGPVMPQVRRAAVRLMKQGRLVILRKGRPVDPDEFRGVYRLALVDGDGKSSPV